MLNSKAILDSPIILFLGAGASAPLGKPLMAEFVAKVSDRIKDDAQKQMLGYLRRFRGDDLEAILGELETIIDLNYADRVSGGYSASGSWVNFSLEREVAWRLRMSLKHEIIREYRHVESSSVVALYEPLFDFIFQYIGQGVCLPVFTTNYDPAIEEFCQLKYPNYQLCDGFGYDPAARHDFWSRDEFDRYQPNKDGRNVVLFKLHGSVDWVRVKSSQRIRRGPAMYDVMDADAYENILIYPATRKIATDDPFYTGYEYFERCCEHARLCLGIGYSFRDYDALTRLRGAVSRNDEVSLLLIDPRAGEVLKSVRIPEQQKVALEAEFSGQIVDRLNIVAKEFGEMVNKPKKSSTASESA